MTYNPQSLSDSVAFIFLDITWSKYWKDKDTKVGQDLGEYPETFNDAKQHMVITLTHSIFPSQGRIPEQTQLCLDSCLMSQNRK